MFSKFFIDRPIFSIVLSLVVLIAGVVSIETLPVEEYPEVTPPQVAVIALYPGASADTISKSVAAPIEQEINGVDDMMYMTSTSSSTGMLSISVSFKIGTDPDQATINVNNRVQQALNSLPQEVQDRGVIVMKRSTNILKLVAIYSENNEYDSTYMANYALINIIDELKRVSGVGDAGLFGNMDYSMRIWLIPDALQRYGLTSTDVISRVSEQNNQFAAGRLNQAPSKSKEAFTYTVTTQGRLQSPEEFGNIIVRANDDGSALRLKDVADIELGSQNYEVDARLNGKIMVPIAIYLQSGANAVQTSNLVNAALERVSAGFPEGLTYSIPYDTSNFIQTSINEVYKTFAEAMLLVMIIIYFFLKSFRATIIPLLAVPVSIIGTFAGMYALGFSINLLTLFGLVLAIGIVVDDAIIVIENVERILHTDDKITVKEATYQAMREVTGPVVAIVLVLCAVFIPVSFMGGFTGQMYKQFAITIVISVCISGMVALTLTPALCAMFIRRKESTPFWAVRKFNDFFDWSTQMFSKGVALTLRYSLVAVLIMGVIFFFIFKLVTNIPTGLVPSEDKGYLISLTNLPAASSLTRTETAMDQLSDISRSNPSVNQTTVVAGVDLNSFALKSSSGLSFIILNDWDQRKAANQSAVAIANQFNMQFNGYIQDALSYTLVPPPITGLSMTGGFEMYVQDRSGGTYKDLGDVVNMVIAEAMKRPELNARTVRSNYDGNVPQYTVIVDREKAKSLGVAITDIYTTLQSTFGAYYVNDFNLFGRTYQVNIQSRDDYRQNPENIKDIYVRSSTSGNLIPLSSLVEYKRSAGADIIERFNVFQSVKIQGEPNIAGGYTSGDALKAIEEVSNAVLPEGYHIGWVGTSYQEKEMAGTGSQAFAFGLVFVFLILAAQYERWLMPLAVVTAVPFAVFGALLAVYLRDLSNDVYFQVGLLVLVGLASKNAVLIVEFAMMLHESGKNIFDASIEAAKLRFRPIVMTSLAFTLGVIPLAISTGAGAASRHSIGTGVIGGMLAATTISIFFVPLFYSWLARLGERYKKSQKSDEQEDIKAVSNEN
ncbi:MAG: efflux RND transporter permease subunit [Campylobacteraceae bacterium]